MTTRVNVLAVAILVGLGGALLILVAPSTTASSTATPQTTTTTSAPVVTTPPRPLSTGGGEGTINLLVHAKARFDPWTKSPSPDDQQTMRSLYDWMVVYSPYFDNRLAWYPNGLAYINLYAIYKNTERDSRSIDHPDWVLTDEDGEWLFIDWGCGGGTCPQWAADVGNPAFRTDFVTRVGALLDKGYPGVMIDDVNLLWRISNGEGERVIPIDPRTGKEMTLGDWQSYVVGLLEQVREAYPSAKIMHNAIWYADSPAFTDDFVRRQTAAADLIMLERGATDRGLKGGDGKFSMASFLKFSDFAHGQGTNVLFLDEDASNVEEQIYNLAAYLLVNNGGDLVSTEDYPMIAPDSLWPGFTIDVGDALGPRYRWEGLWRRDFTGGIVLVNNPGDPTASVSLGTSYRDLSGNSVSSVTLGSRSAEILLPPFTDTAGSVFKRDIEWLAARGITRGCNPPVNDRFCPDDLVTRGQMAAFLNRALGLTAAPDRFTDTADSVFSTDIGALAAAGITRGCNPPTNTRFCPDDPVTRGQMAAFLVRALGYTDNGGGDLFTDDNGTVFESDIDRLGTAGVTRGCNPPTNDRFCPDDPVTRGQMAAFLNRALAN